MSPRRPLRVGLVCPYSLAVHGGVQNHVLELAAHLHRAGHQVQVLAPGEAPEGLPDYVSTVGRALPMPYNGSVARVSFGPLVAGAVRRWLAQGDFDVVHIHEPATPSVSVLALWATEAPVVATFHTAQDRTRTLETSAATFLRHGLAKIDAHVAVSPEARRTMARYLDADPVLIPNGVDAGLYRSRARAGHATADPRQRPGGPLDIVFVGRLDEPRKGLPVLLRALPAVLAQHPAARVRLVGAGGGSAVTTLLRGLPEPTRRQVEVLGVVSEADKARVLGEADLLVAPNTRGESFGIVLIEAMAASTGVVASDLPAFRHVLDEGRLGTLFRAGDPADLARAMLEMADPAVRGPRVAAATEAAQSYDWRCVTPRILDLYTRVQTPGTLPATG